MEIIDYNNIYEKEFKNLLMELQKYIVKLDKEEYNKIEKILLGIILIQL